MADLDLIDKIAERVKPLGSGADFHDLPTVAQLATEFKVTQSAVVNAVEATYNLDLVVGIRTGSGFGRLPKGQQRVEWIGEEP